METRQALISIVDDEACVRDSLSSLLRSAGYETREYASAEEFLTWGWWDETACLILDVRLPGMGGLELQRYLEDKQAAAPMVLISGHATGNEQAWAAMNGVVAFLRKPFSDESLLRAIEKATPLSRAESVLPDGIPRKGVCPLCHASAPIAVIPKRFVREHGELYGSTLELIRSLNRQWSAQEGLCHRCWRFYLGLGRVVNFLRSPHAPPAADQESHSPAGIP